MKRVTITVDQEVDLKFRKKASQKYQFEKGWYSNAVAEAMNSWAEDDKPKEKIRSSDFNIMEERINPELWDKINSGLQLDDENLSENFESFINQFNQDTRHQIKIERKNGGMAIKLENNNDCDIETNLESLILLNKILEIIIVSLEETSREKFEIVGAGTVPEIYIKKAKN